MNFRIFNRKGQESMQFPDLPPLPQEHKKSENVVEHKRHSEKMHESIKPHKIKIEKTHKKKIKTPVKKPNKKNTKHQVVKTKSISHKIKHKEIKKKRPEIKQQHENQKAQNKKQVLSKESIKLKAEPPKKSSGDVLEKYELEADGAFVKAEIRRDEAGITYNLYIPEISEVTSALLEDIRNELITVTTISTKEMTDPNLFYQIKKRFMDDARKLVEQKLPHTKKDFEDFLVGTLMQEMLGLGKIEFLIADPNLEEIVIPSAKEPIRVYYKKYGWLMTNLRIEREEEIVNYSNIIARRVGKQITVLSPLLDAHLVTGDRINAVLYPVNTKGNTITIRKFARDPFTIIDFINNKTCSIEIAALLWLAIEYEMNVLISGGTGSGKTSFLNACMPFVPPNQRIISIEDTRELMLPDFLYWTPLVTRTPNPEGKGEVSMLDLLVNSLRMRPDRIILGEMRKEKEAMVLFEAMHTGHSVYATVHADTAAETISRLVNPPLNVPPNLLKGVNLNVVMFRDRRKGIRRTSQIAEFEAEKLGAKANVLYRWVAERDEIVKHSESSRFFEDISRNTGMSESEINSELTEKKKILEWLIKSNIRGLEDFGNVMNLFYRNKELLMKAISQNNKELIFKKREIKKETFNMNEKELASKKELEKTNAVKKTEEPKKEIVNETKKENVQLKQPNLKVALK